MSDDVMGAAMPAARPVSRVAEAYNMDVVRKFTIAAMFWAVVAFLVGVVIAAQLALPIMIPGLEWTAFGPLRPVDTCRAALSVGSAAPVPTPLSIG